MHPIIIAIAIIIAIPIFFAEWLHDSIGIPRPITYILLAAAVSWLSHKYISGYISERNRRFQAIQIANVDQMTGIEFEVYLKKLLNTQGFDVHMTPGSGDLGVDLVASKAGDRIAIQVKRYQAKVSRRAISDAVAGMNHYKCNKAMVITNSYFTPGARSLAASTSCTLIDRDTLTTWIVEMQSGGMNGA